MSRLSRSRSAQRMAKRIRLVEQAEEEAERQRELEENRAVVSETSVSTRSTSEEDGNSSEDTSATSTSSLHEVIPGLPQEISIRIVARVPRGVYPLLRQVSKTWREILRPNFIYRIRQEFRVAEDWVFMGTESPQMGHPPIWKVLDLNSMKWYPLPDMPLDHMFGSCDRECFVAGRKLLVVGRTQGMASIDQVIYQYDSDLNEWSRAKPMIEDRSLFASATFGKYAIVAGGTGGGQPCRKSAELIDSESGEWELLEPMHVARRECSGFIMDKCFYVIGGMTMNADGQWVPVNSAERYDFETRTWTLIDNMWPTDLPQPNVGERSPPLVAVVSNELYALNSSCYEVLSFNKRTTQWSSLGRVPSRAITSNGWGLGFRAVGDELCVLGGTNINNSPVPWMDACTPNGGLPVWRRVTDTWSNFISNCAVMKS